MHTFTIHLRHCTRIVVARYQFTSFGEACIGRIEALASYRKLGLAVVASSIN